jgi:ferredoxin
MFTGCGEGEDFCPAHRIIIREQRSEQKRLERKRQETVERRRNKKPEVPMAVERRPPVIGPPGDPTAPYCTCKGRTADHEPCTNCGKPHFMDWRESKLKKKETASGNQG